jgi:hypothetical protein
MRVSDVGMPNVHREIKRGREDGMQRKSGEGETTTNVMEIYESSRSFWKMGLG